VTRRTFQASLSQAYSLRSVSVSKYKIIVNDVNYRVCSTLDIYEVLAGALVEVEQTSGEGWPNGGLLILGSRRRFHFA
jgi:hypothetical protein